MHFPIVLLEEHYCSFCAMCASVLDNSFGDPNLTLCPMYFMILWRIVCAQYTRTFQRPTLTSLLCKQPRNRDDCEKDLYTLQICSFHVRSVIDSNHHQTTKEKKSTSSLVSCNAAFNATTPVRFHNAGTFTYFSIYFLKLRCSN